MVSQCQPVPQDVTICSLWTFLVALFLNYILNGIDFISAVRCVDDYILSLAFGWTHDSEAHLAKVVLPCITHCLMTHLTFGTVWAIRWLFLSSVVVFNNRASVAVALAWLFGIDFRNICRVCIWSSVVSLHLTHIAAVALFNLCGPFTSLLGLDEVWFIWFFLLLILLYIISWLLELVINLYQANCWCCLLAHGHLDHRPRVACELANICSLLVVTYSQTIYTVFVWSVNMAPCLFIVLTWTRFCSIFAMRPLIRHFDVVIDVVRNLNRYLLGAANNNLLSVLSKLMICSLTQNLRVLLRLDCGHLFHIFIFLTLFINLFWISWRKYPIFA